MVEVAVRIAPIVLIIALGNVVRVTKLLSQDAIGGLQKLVVNVALPAVLLRAFLDIELQRSYIGVFVLVFVVCLLLLVYGRVIHRVVHRDHPYFPFLMTGFEFGMLAITLFGTAYGMDQIGSIAVVGMSHELFIWFIFVTLLTVKRDGKAGFGDTLRGFAKSPLIIAIVLGIGLNAAGLGDWVHTSAAPRVVLQTLEVVASMLIPAILLIIGYGMRVSFRGMAQAAVVLLLRYAVVVPIALLVNRFVVADILGLPKAFEVALFTFLILPPPFIVPLFMPADAEEERGYVNNVLSLATIVTVVVFIVTYALNPTLG